ncbi:hypothetical protein AS188_03020 [Kocuria flava]|uniref:Uncharacterized protein n=1 Tax=Kocuria flava TaxID=446860 RepID=A0A0U3HMS4_9MICC|nr:hypothetical protein AS188_03020 [Kocuria flava]
MRVVPGRWDAAAAHVFARGQCLALAVAVAETTGGPVAAHVERRGDREVLRHCWAHLDDRTVVDGSGAHDLRVLRAVAGRRCGEAVRTLDPAAAWARWARDLVPQDLALARSFVPRVLARSRTPGRGAHTVRRTR